jgi:hypothetical protein
MDIYEMTFDRADTIRIVELSALLESAMDEMPFDNHPIYALITELGAIVDGHEKR